MPQPGVAAPPRAPGSWTGRPVGRPARPGGAARLQALASALAAHDPDRTVERGYALVTGADGEVVTSARRARDARFVRLRFADAAVDATINRDDHDDRA